MAGTEIGSKRNVALFGHHGTGKTTLIEAILYHKKKFSRMGRSQDGNTFSDFTPDEKKRGHSIWTTLVHLGHRKHELNLLDLPGVFDFVAETRNGLRAADAAIAVVSAYAGVEVETEKSWELLEAEHKPCLVVINQLDRERSSFENTLEGVVAVMGNRCAPLHLPIGAEAGFKGVVDVVAGKALMFDTTGGHELQDPPADMADAVAAAREKLYDFAAEIDEAVMEKYLEGQALTDEEFIGGLRKAVANGSFVPVLCTSAEKALGMQALLNVIVDYLPAPDFRPATTVTIAGSDQSLELKPTENQPLAAYVFKTRIDSFAGKWSFVRIYAGKMATDKPLMIGNKDSALRISGMLEVSGSESVSVPVAGPGDIVVLAKVDSLATGDTICDAGKNFVLPPTPLPTPTILQAISAANAQDEEKLGSALSRLVSEDPSLCVFRNPETKQAVLSGMGEIHLQVALSRLREAYSVEAELAVPRVAYRETVTANSDGMYRHKKQSGGHGQFAEVHLRMAPKVRGEGFEFLNAVVGGTIPTKFIPAVEKGVREALDRGIQAAYPVVDLAVTVHFGKAHDVDSSEMAFKIAASRCFREVAAKCKPILLEPIMNVEITVPEANMGEIISNLNTKRGRILGMEPLGKKQLVKAQVPAAEMSTYSVDLRSITQGRGSFTMEHSHYDPVPAEITAKIVASAEVGGADEED